MKKINLSITGCLGRMGQQLIKSSRETKNFEVVSITENKKINKITIKEEISVSLLEGQVTFCNSCLTCLTKSAGDVFLFSIFFFLIIGRSGRT